MVDRDGNLIKRWEYLKNGHRNVTNNKGGISGIEDTVQIPTHSLAIEWIRVNFDVWIEIRKTTHYNIVAFQSYFNGIPLTGDLGGYVLHKTPQEATEAALLHVLKNYNE